METNVKMSRHIAETLIGKQSRKVAFGIWLFFAANAFLSAGKIDVMTWWKCTLLSGLLIGFGTVLDSIIEAYGTQAALRFAPPAVGGSNEPARAA